MNTKDRIYIWAGSSGRGTRDGSCSDNQMPLAEAIKLAHRLAPEGREVAVLTDEPVIYRIAGQHVDRLAQRDNLTIRMAGGELFLLVQEHEPAGDGLRTDGFFDEHGNV